MRSSAVTRVAELGDLTSLVIGLDLRGAGQGPGSLAVTGLAISGVVILAAASHTLMRPLTQAEKALATHAAGLLPRRVPEPPGGEAARLAVSLNTMLSQLEHAFGTQAAAEAAARASRARMCRIIIETGQQLRKPLGIIHGIAGSYRRGQPTASDLDRMMRQLASHATRLDALLHQLTPTPSDQLPPQQ